MLLAEDINVKNYQTLNLINNNCKTIEDVIISDPQ